MGYIYISRFNVPCHALSELQEGKNGVDVAEEYKMRLFSGRILSWAEDSPYAMGTVLDNLGMLLPLGFRVLDSLDILRHLGLHVFDS